MQAMDDLDAGALVGWKANPLGNRILLTMQTMHLGQGEEKELRERAIMVDKNQAVLLANYLYELTGQSKPRRRTVLQTIFGT